MLEQVEEIIRTELTRTRCWLALAIDPDDVLLELPTDDVPEALEVDPVAPDVAEPLELGRLAALLLEELPSIVPVISTSWPTWLLSSLSLPSRT